MREFIADKNVVNDFARGLRQNKYKWHQFYNIVDPTIDAMHRTINSYNFSSKPKKLPLLYFDIEVDADDSTFPEPYLAKWAVNSLSIYDNISNRVTCMVIEPYPISDLKKKILEKYNEEVKRNPKYHIEDITIEIISFKNDLNLLEHFFKMIQNSPAIALVGYNSGIFDIPYIFNRLKRLTPNWKNIASKHGQVDTYGEGKNKYFTIPDIIFIDMLYLYKPQSAGGADMGKAQVSYSLDYIANAEIGIGKMEYEGNLVSLYQDNPVAFFVYNIFDTALLHLLNSKLKHIDNMYGLAKFAKAPMSKALIGRSLLYQFQKTMNYWDKGLAVRSKLYNEEYIAYSNVE